MEGIPIYPIPRAMRRARGAWESSTTRSRIWAFQAVSLQVHVADLIADPMAGGTRLRCKRFFARFGGVLADIFDIGATKGYAPMTYRA